MEIYSYEPFGYEGCVVNVEVDVRRGIPSVDLVGLADSQVAETREVIKAAFRNSGLDFPAERVLISLSPADLRKEGDLERLAVATAIHAAERKISGDEKILVLGGLDLSGAVRPVRAVQAAVTSAKAAGIYKVIVPEQNLNEALEVPGIEALPVSSLNDIRNAFEINQPFVKKEATQNAEKNVVEFNENLLKEAEQNVDLGGYYKAARAIEIAVAGKHNILLVGAPGSGKTMLSQYLIPALTPKLTNEEAQVATRIHSIAGLMSPNEGLKKDAPFRQPHMSASLEGMCGGGTKCRPGEISLAHNGVLFLDEAAEFRSSVLQMMRVPLETGKITLSRAGRTAVFPSNFQLAMTTNPCPCGCAGSHDKMCLCSERSIDLYWKKFSAPLLDRVPIKEHVEKDASDSRKITVQEMKEKIEAAMKIQRERGTYNDKLRPEEVAEYCKLDQKCQELLDREAAENGMSPRMAAYTKKIALTIANMDGRTEINMDDLKESLSFTAKPSVYEWVASGFKNKPETSAENKNEVNLVSTAFELGDKGWQVKEENKPEEKQKAHRQESGMGY